MKKKPTKGLFGMPEASEEEIEYFESFQGEPITLAQVIAQSRLKYQSITSKKETTDKQSNNT